VFKGRGSGWISEHKDKDAYVNTRTGYVKPIDPDAGDLPDDGEWHLFLDEI